MKEPLTPECIVLYLETLADLSEDQFKIVIRRAMNELEWFPKPAKIRELAGVAVESIQAHEAEAAWQWVENYLNRWGVDRLPIYRGGNCLEAPQIPDRIAQALRAVGGLAAVNQATTESRPFTKRDFIAAYIQAPITSQHVAKLPELAGRPKQIA